MEKRSIESVKIPTLFIATFLISGKKGKKKVRGMAGKQLRGLFPFCKLVGPWKNTGQ